MPDLRVRALQLLTRRDYSRAELQKKLAAQKLITAKGKNYVPAMQINGAPIPKPEIYFENGVKIIRFPPMYAEGYARMRNL